MTKEEAIAQADDLARRTKISYYVISNRYGYDVVSGDYFLKNGESKIFYTSWQLKK
jgi:hypothetical protein